jgi:hypothetical protein
LYVERSHVKGQKSQAQGTRSSKLRAADLENACSLDLTPGFDDLMGSFDELFLTCMLSELYLHVYLHLCTSHMARRKTASCHAKATMHLALVEAAIASDTPLATFQVERGLHQRAVSFFSCSCSRIYTTTHIWHYVPLASDMQPRSHPSPPRITRCLFVRCWSYRLPPSYRPQHSAWPSTVRMQQIEITTETHPPTGVSAPEHNSTIGPDLPFHLTPRALVP